MDRERRQLSGHEIYLLLREEMGHTWPIGTFNRAEQVQTDIIEGEYRVVEPVQELREPRQLPKGK